MRGRQPKFTKGWKGEASCTLWNKLEEQGRTVKFEKKKAGVGEWVIKLRKNVTCSVSRARGMEV